MSGSISRPAVAVVMPFAGSGDQARSALGALGALTASSGDERWLADNSDAVTDLGGAPAGSTGDGAVRIVAAGGERSPAHARNAGAAAVGDGPEWILFVDADVVGPPDLIDRYFAGAPIGASVGAVAGGIVARPPGPGAGLAARYGAHKNFLDPGAHLSHPFMPRAAAANLLVRRAAFAQLGGFVEGLRAAEDTDFCWRLQLAGWSLAACPDAAVEHAYRGSLAALRRQWRSYAAGRAWLARRYGGFEPQPAVVRAARRATTQRSRRSHERLAGKPGQPEHREGEECQLEADKSHDHGPRGGTRARPKRFYDRVAFATLDAILGIDELIGFAQSNRPPGAGLAADAGIVLIADRYPAVGNRGHDAVAALARPADAADEWVSTVRGAANIGAREPATVRVEAAARPVRPGSVPPGVTVVYREDDGADDRRRALTTLSRRWPGRCLLDYTRRQRGIPLGALAPAAIRLLQSPGTEPWLLDYDPRTQLAAERIGELAATGLASFPAPPAPDRS